MHVRVASRGRGITGFDVLALPGVGRFLRWRHARTALQLLLLCLALVVVGDGLLSARTDPTRVSTLLTWVHYRGLLVIALLAAGNLFCTACPFVLVRDAGRRIRPPWMVVPRWLRTKWIGIAHFVSALVVDTIFTGATFCKYLCPIGQFNFIASTMSPLELRVKEAETCRSCRTADCIKGRHAPAGHGRAKLVTRGCELRLFLPSKVGNLDCTLCLDCVHACPHDNIALAARVPGAELADGRRRSGIGRLSRRSDIAALAIVFAFGSLVNAFGMVSAGRAVEVWLGRALGAGSEAPALAALFAVVLIAAPALVLGVAAMATRALTADATRSSVQIAVDFAYALVPFGFGMWLAHYGFHLLTGALAVIPAVQRAAADAWGTPILGEPLWRLTGLRPGEVFPIQVGFIVLGAMGSVAAARRIAERDYPAQAGRAAASWILATVLLTAAALWLVAQPMDMRGLGFAG